ncbi:hypothetical protein DQ240_07345 [Blastococcus sp. TF02A-26]|nr:hypothetical protein DQ240_07345 [Blastococcus sp. TF02A-26]
MDRRRQRIAVLPGETCSLCGHEGLELIESERVLRGLRRLVSSHRRRRYKSCPACAASEVVRIGGRHR